MLRFFQKLVDPFVPDGNTQPPADVWAYLRHNLKPFRWVIAVSLRHFFPEHLQTDGERVAGPHRPCQKFERVRELRLEFPHSSGALA